MSRPATFALLLFAAFPTLAADAPLTGDFDMVQFQPLSNALRGE